MRDIDNKTRVIDPEQITTIILQKSQENDSVLEPMLEKSKISSDKKQQQQQQEQGEKFFQCLSTLIGEFLFS